jgi:hypothetical protein
MTDDEKAEKRRAYHREWARRRREDPEYQERQRQKDAEFRKNNPEKVRERNRRAYEKQDPEKRRQRGREGARKRRADPEWRAAHLEKRRSYYAATDPDRLLAIRDRDRCKTYGLLPGQFEEMWNEQGGVCKICNTVPKPRRDGGDGRHVDHDHATGQIRGIVCMRCNRWLIPLEDEEWLAAALVYLGRR